MSITEILTPRDSYNEQLEANVHPPDWQNPTPDGRYNLVVIGAGTAGLVTAAGAAGLGAKVALIEKNLMGGDCLNVGCVPSKALLHDARVAEEARNAAQYGVRIDGEVHVEFSAVMERMRRLRASISPNDSAERFRKLGVDVYLGEAKFTGSDTVEVGGQTLQFSKACIATGARAAKLPIDGLEAAGYLTNESIFSLTVLPRRLAVIGGGPIGSEMAQTFARFGSEVTQIEKSTHILAREDTAAAEIVQESLRSDGVRILLNSELKRVEVNGSEKVLHVESEGESVKLHVDEILVGIGRQPNVELNLEAAGVEYDTREGVKVNDRLQTSNSRVYAAGDVASKFKFTHAADFLARTVIRNALFMGRGKASALMIPWATYTSPELAHVGLTEKQALSEGIEIDTYTQEFEHVDRAILDGQTTGFVKVHVAKGKDKILGATIVAEHAGDLISQFSLAMTNNIGLGKIGNTIYPYPTQAEAIRKLGDQYSRTKLTPFTAKLLRWMINFTSSR
ncbi:mercuric reductase [Calycomorphotria hydatis]|nr:mercuric reductase [Calycomorphotria hydatis]